jgi:hypothetical protein
MMNEVPIFVKPGTVIPGQVCTNRRINDKCYHHLLMTIYPGDSGSYDLYEDDGITTDYLGGKFAVISMSHETQGNTQRIRVTKTRGHFEGYSSDRSLEVRLEGSVPPASISIGNRKLEYVFRLDEAKEGWTYDGLTATTVIKIASFNLDKGVEIIAKYAPGTDHRLANGLRGAFNRLARMNEIVTTIEACVFMYPDTRLTQDVFCTANRISRWPETFTAEIKQFKKNLARLPKAIAEMSASTYESSFNMGIGKRIDQGKVVVNMLRQITL